MGTEIETHHHSPPLHPPPSQVQTTQCKCWQQTFLNSLDIITWSWWTDAVGGLQCSEARLGREQKSCASFFWISLLHFGAQMKLRKTEGPNSQQEQQKTS